MIEKLETAVRQEQIAQAVLKIIAEGGLDAVRVSAVAKEIGVVPGALYRHFAGKDKMIMAALDTVRIQAEKMFDALDKCYKSPLAWMDAAVESIPGALDHAVAIPRVIFGMSSNPANNRVLSHVADNLHQPVLNRLSAKLTAAQEQGQIKPDLNPETLAMIFFGLHKAAMIRWYITRGEANPATFTREAWQILRAGIVTSGRNGNA